jgi:uncharacterized membrane protein
MAQFCTNCGGQVPDNASNCPACGKAVVRPAGTGATAGPVQAGGLADNIAGMLAYVTIIPAIIFLVLEPYNRNRFIRFHAFQSIFFYVAMFALSVAVTIIGVLPVLGWATLLLWPLVYLAVFVVWLLMVVKAYGGQMWKLPVIGDMAEKQANAM